MVACASYDSPFPDAAQKGADTQKEKRRMKDGVLLHPEKGCLWLLLRRSGCRPLRGGHPRERKEDPSGG